MEYDLVAFVYGIIIFQVLWFIRNVYCDARDARLRHNRNIAADLVNQLNVEQQNPQCQDSHAVSGERFNYRELCSFEEDEVSKSPVGAQGSSVDNSPEDIEDSSDMESDRAAPFVDLGLDFD